MPKFHCELNPIEGLWCYLKQYVRKRTNCNFDTMLYLISEARTVFNMKQIYMKLWRRFWRVVAAYHKKVNFEDILHIYFTGKTKAKIEAHRKIYNTNLSDEE